MGDLKIILEVNEHGELVLPFSRRVLNLPRIENCHQLRDLIVQQDNNFAWFYLKKYEKIRFKTTERKLNEVFNQDMTEKRDQSVKCEDVVLIDNDKKTAGNEEDDGDIQWISGPNGSSNMFSVQQN